MGGGHFRRIGVSPPSSLELRALWPVPAGAFSKPHFFAEPTSAISLVEPSI